MTVIEHCPTCGAAVTVSSGADGTNHYVPVNTRRERETVNAADQLQGAVDMIRALRDELGAPAADHGGRVMSAWRLADDWLTANGGQS